MFDHVIKKYKKRLDGLEQRMSTIEGLEHHVATAQAHCKNGAEKAGNRLGISAVVGHSISNHAGQNESGVFLQSNRNTVSDLEGITGSNNLGNFIPKPRNDLLRQDVVKGLGVVDRILGSTDEEFSSRSFLLDCLLEYGIPMMSADIFAPWIAAMNPSGFGALQFPTEFVDCLRVLARLNIETAAEIGSFRGGSSYFIASVLQRANPTSQLTLIDIDDRLINFDAFAEKLNIIKAVPKSSDDLARQPFDFVFIDGDHRYIGAMRDFANLGKYARKAVAFHDIHGHEFDHEEGGTVRAWNEVKAQLRTTHTIYEFAHSVPRSLGIGLAVAQDATLAHF